MNNIGHKYGLYIDDNEIRRDALSRLPFTKMQGFHLLALEMKSAIRGLGYAPKHIVDALIIHFPDHRNWNKKEEGLIQIISKSNIPIYLIYNENEKNIDNTEFEKVNYLPYSNPLLLLQEVKNKIKWNNAC